MVRKSIFCELIRLLAQGGLQVSLLSDGRKADLLEKILTEKLVARMTINILGPASVYLDAKQGSSPALSQEDLEKSLKLARAHPNHIIRLWFAPLRSATGKLHWLSPTEEGEVAKMVYEACGETTMPFGIQLCPNRPEGLNPLDDHLLPYRAKVRHYLPKAEILKSEIWGA